MSRIATGVPGLDEILRGGLPREHVYLVQGKPGAGKTTLTGQFLMEGARLGEKSMYVSLLQAKKEFEEAAISHGWKLEGIDVVSLASAAEAEAQMAEQTLLPMTEVRLDQVIDALREALDKVNPVRLVFDSVDQLRLIVNDPALYRQKVLAILRLLGERRVTAIFTEPNENSDFKTLVHGVIMLDWQIPSFGEMHRRLWIEKMRGIVFEGGYHAFMIRTGGSEVYPRLPMAQGAARTQWRIASSNIPELDQMLGGGLEYGTACLLTGQSGTGKSSTASAYACAAAERGDHVLILLFDERVETYVRRSEGLGFNIRPLMEKGLLTIQQIAVGELTAGQMGHIVREAVEQLEMKVIVIDSLRGYYAALPDELQLSAQLHEMLTYLGQHDVLSMIVMLETSSPMGGIAGFDASYLADTVILLRRFEAMGEIRFALSVTKKRHGNHEKTIREFKITTQGLCVGDPLSDFQGVLTGEPTYVGERKKLME